MLKQVQDLETNLSLYQQLSFSFNRFSQSLMHK